MSRSRVLGWALLTVPLALLLALVRREVPRGELLPRPQAEASAELPSASPLGYAHREPAALEPASEPTQERARDFLARYHGDAWPEVEARLEAAGVALDGPYVFHPWEEAEPIVRAGYRLAPEERAQTLLQKLDWPDELTLDWVRSEFDTGRPYPLAEEDLPVLRDLVADLNLELLGKAELYCDLLDATIQERFQRGQFVRQPYSSQAVPSSAGFHATAVGALGWGTSMSLTREEHPELAALLDEMRALRQTRRERIVRHLHGKIGR